MITCSTHPTRALIAAVVLLCTMPLPARAQQTTPAEPMAAAKPIRVQVLGAVSRPGNVYVNDGDRLTMALVRVGAEAWVNSDLNRVFLTRVDPATGKTMPSYMINVFEALKKGDLRYDPILREGDRIYVPEMRPFRPVMIAPRS